MWNESISLRKSEEVNWEPRSVWNMTPFETPLRLTASRKVVLCQEKVQIKYAIFSVELPC